MESILAAFARAAAGDPAGLAEARRAWSAVAPGDRALLADLGRHLATPGSRSDGLSDVLAALAAGEIERARRATPGLTASERELIGPIGRHVAAQAEPVRLPGLEAAGRPVDEEEAAWLAAQEGLGADEDPYEGYDFAGEVAREAAEAVDRARPRRSGIHSDRTPEDLLALMGLDEFRPSQREAVQAALDGRDSLVVMPTGGGKSLCYQLPALASDALTVVVSPLIALIADQHRRLVDAGHRSVMLASNLGPEHNRAALDEVRSGRAQIVFCAPERFASRALRAALLTRDIALFVVDEAHCVSEWGHDFRPDYLRLRPVIELLGQPPVMACTATATPRVAAEIAGRLGLRDPLLVRRGFDRPNISFDVIALAGDGAVARKRGILLAGLSDPGNRPAIVYCGTRKDTEQVAALLAGAGIPAAPYHAGMDGAARNRSQDEFMAGTVDVVVATNAFGQGIDKDDIRSVWHWALPSSVEGYYQEAGRAGRDGAPARAVLLAMRGDLGRLIQFIKSSEMTVADVKGVVERLRREARDGVALIDPRGQDDRDRIALAVAERAGTITLAPAPGGRLAATITGRLDEYAARSVCREATNRRWTAYQALKRFADSQDVCRRRQLLDHFGDDTPTAPDGRCCDVCSPIDWIDVEAASRTTRGRAAGGSSRTPGGAPRPAGPPVDEGEFEALKRWRYARAEGKPAYTVAANATLEEILRRRPGSTDELLAIRGIGPAFVEKHGADLLSALGSL
ncbi:MAG: ATP-dependent helicase RecQ [Solirubrobacteraceae bacterium]|nr:ATP-dependent helicase RecQ [Solirubrobacteraceae bacterium]